MTKAPLLAAEKDSTVELTEGGAGISADAVASQGRDWRRIVVWLVTSIRFVGTGPLRRAPKFASVLFLAVCGLVVGFDSSHAAAAAFTPGQAGASGHSRVIRVWSGSISVGSYRILGGTTLPTYAAAIAVWGSPQACALQGLAPGSQPLSNNGRATWHGLGVVADFVTYGGFSRGGDACSEPGDVQLDSLTLTGGQWRTGKGLRNGDSIAKLQRLYPHALPHGNSFWIIVEKNVIGSVFLYPVVSVTLDHGRVGSFVFNIRAEGD